jgi:nitrite reductase/ring-hydroxylating ferredoxin subunit
MVTTANDIEISLCPADEIPLGMGRAFELRGRSIAVFRTRHGKIYAVENTCPHRGGPLAGGRLVDGELACPWHGFRFDPATGQATMPTLHPPAHTIPVRRVGDDVQILLPPPL